MIYRLCLQTVPWAMAPIKVCLATLLIFAALYRFLQSGEEDFISMLQPAEWKARATSILSLAFRRQLSAMDKVDRKVGWSISERSAVKAQEYFSCAAFFKE